MEKIELPKKIVIIPQDSVGISLGTCSVPGLGCIPGMGCDSGVVCVGMGCN
ncbi:hypothetical protein CcarbDRAFT_5004 [Clostridium carboxidivorans P7]|uniref:Uncharacterized protein n=1 Tax=Clostridium carboxidivorans P7 TaxID=536227 RepID=C6Q1T6_9CLOT|nr:hypothetical protein [Clostridium carboxidivorans]EET84553.1 hypothetical protein CcarbDRAFT_5004 [Clostridium carboxidivorans P7]EFG89853.1 hypothetical protein CLCAR_0046 [Clostridium carboxidivorans P7]